MGTLLLWLSGNMDDIAIRREHKIAELAISELQFNMAHNQESSTYWDEAVEKVAAPDGADWIDQNFGTWMHTFYGFDELYVFDGDDRPIYAFADGKISEPDKVAGRYDFARPLFDRLRADLREGKTPPTGQQSLGVCEFAIVNGRPALFSLKPILSDSGEPPKPGEPVYLHLALQYLDGATATRIAQSYVLEGFHVTTAGETADGEETVPVQSVSGEPDIAVKWTPFRPGHQLVLQAIPVLLILALALLAGTSALSAFWYLRLAEKKRNEDRLRYLSSHDALTDLKNRAAYEEIADQLIAGMEASPSVEPLSVMFMDLDRFKQVNDIYGHQAGDLVLIEFARRAAALLPDGAELFRIGGDEFAVIYQRCDQRRVEALCKAIIDSLSAAIDLNGRKAFVGVTIGVAFAPSHGTERTEIDRKADVALYHAKAAGRGRYAIFGTQMDDTIRTSAIIEEDLRAAMSDMAAFAVHFQPKFGCKDGRVQGVEALVRWTHPEKGPISPAVFIPVAETVGLIGALGAWVLERACERAKGWPGTHLAVNVSPKQLAERGFDETVAAILKRTGFPADRLEFEVTESVLQGSGEEAVQCLHVLADMGISVAIDDFGTGASNFTRLQDVDFDRIKIDQSFVRNIESSKSDAEIVRAMIALAHARGIKATAEGVETQEQRHVLCALGCDELQGYLLGRPVPPEAIDKLF